MASGRKGASSVPSAEEGSAGESFDGLGFGLEDRSHRQVYGGNGNRQKKTPAETSAGARC